MLAARSACITSTLPMILGFAAGCSGGAIVDDEVEGEVSCENLDESQCLFPFPSDYFRSTADGPELRFPVGSLPHRGSGALDPRGYRQKRGFSAITPIYFVLEGAGPGSLEEAPAWDDIGASLDPSSATVIADAETGELVPHWAEIDVFSLMGDVPTPVIALRLARRLEFDRRYVVAVRRLVGEDRGALPPTPGFRALRDREPSTRRGVGGRRAHFEERVFPVLERAGIERSSLQLAWDFTTDTEENVTGTLLAARDAVLGLVGEDGPAFEITAVDENPNAEIARHVHGVARVPSLLEGSRGELQLLRLDAEGRPAPSGYEDVEFELQIPRSVWEGAAPGHVVQYGHGLLGRRSQATGSWLRTQAEEQGFVILAADLQGMTDEDLEIWLEVLLDDLSGLPHLSAKPMQGLVNHLALVRMLRGGFARSADPRFTRGGSPVYDPDRIRYLGNSQGGTMGGVMMSIHQDIERGVLGVPGGAFSFLLTRASIFVLDMGTLMIQQFADDMRDFVANMGLVQLAFDRIDPINFLHRITEDPFPGTPPHRVLLQVAKEDAQVHNQVSDLVARTVAAKLIAPAVREVWGLETTPGPWAGNTMAEFDFGLPDFSNQLVPIELDVTHGCLRRLPAARRQIQHFYETGEVQNFCDWDGGSCVVPDAWNEENCNPDR